MKQTFLHLRKAFPLFTLAIALTAASLPVRASNGDEDKKSPGSASTAEVKYLGSQQGQPLFKVQYKNQAGARFSIRVLDSEGNQLFQALYTDKNFDKTFRLAEAESNNSPKLLFVLRNFKDNSVQTFEVNNNTRLVEEVEVKEVK